MSQTSKRTVQAEKSRSGGWPGGFGLVMGGNEQLVTSHDVMCAQDGGVLCSGYGMYNDR